MESFCQIICKDTARWFFENSKLNIVLTFNLCTGCNKQDKPAIRKIYLSLLENLNGTSLATKFLK